MRTLSLLADFIMAKPRNPIIVETIFLNQKTNLLLKSHK